MAQKYKGKYMNLYQCQEWAKDNGFDKAKFIALFPSGPTECQWLDAYMGLLQIDKLGDGFVMVKQIDKMFPDLHCQPLEEA